MFYKKDAFQLHVAAAAGAPVHICAAYLTHFIPPFSLPFISLWFVYICRDATRFLH